MDVNKNRQTYPNRYFVLQIVLALEVTFFVANAVSKAPIMPTKLISQAKESTLDSAQKKSKVNLQTSAHEEDIKVISEPLDKPLCNRTKNYRRGHFQTVVSHLLRETNKVNLENTSLTLPNEVKGNQHGSKGKKVFFHGRTKNPNSKSINDGISAVLTQTPYPDLLDSWSRKSLSKNIDELVEPLQQANILTSPQRLKEGNRDEIPIRKQILVPDPAYQPSKVLGNEFKFTVIPKSFTRSKQESIVAPPQDYLIEPGDMSVVVQTYDSTLGEMLVPNILAQQAIDALKEESDAILKLDSISYFALECLLPPLDAKLETDHYDTRPSLDLLGDSDVDPVKTILHLWESDEYGKLGSDFSKDDEETRTEGDEEGGDNNYDDNTL